MLRLLCWVPQIAVIGFVAYWVLTSLPGLGDAPRAPRTRPARRFLVLVPAHDEEAVIAAVLGDLARQEYPQDLYEVVVVADRCSDRTAELARPLAKVYERTSGAGGKGAALADAVERYGSMDAVVVLDADNRVPSQLLTRFNDELADGHEVVQAYLDVVRPAGIVALASALTYWAGNRVVQLARSRLGWSADLGGTGMCLSSTALDAVGGFGRSLTEDQELGVRLLLAGHHVHWMHDVRVQDEKPRSLPVAVRQRARWTLGRRELARRYVGTLVGQAWRRRNWAYADVAIRLLQPGRSFIAMVTGALFVVALVTDSSLLLPIGVLGAAAGVQFLWPVVFLAREAVPWRYLLAYPLITIIALLWLPVRVMSRIQRGWYHTPHGALKNHEPRADGDQDERPPG